MGECVSFFGGAIVIVLRRLGGGLFALNPDLIERVEATPDTVVTLIDDKKFLVDETLEQVLELIVDYRAYVIIRSTELSVVHDSGRPTLHVVPNEYVTSTENSLAPGVDLDFGSEGSNPLSEMLDEMDAEYNERFRDGQDGEAYDETATEGSVGSDLSGGGR